MPRLGRPPFLMKPAFPLSSIVYLHINSERKGMVTGHLYRPGGMLLYLVTWDDPVDEKEHCECELSETRIMDLPGGDNE